MRKTFNITATYVQGHAVEQNIKNHNIYLTSFSILYIHSLYSRFINYAGGMRAKLQQMHPIQAGNTE